jgi:adenylylsulfate kinase
VLDGDNIRHGLNSDLGFSPVDRKENIRRIAEVASLFCDAAVVALTAFISPYARDRALARGLQPDRFVEVYCAAGLEVCERRDPKGIYRKARSGQLKGLTGIDAPYEVPEAPELTLDTEQLTVEECAARVVEVLEDRGVI